MSYNIINEIRWMKHNYQKQYGNHGKIIYLNANAEAKLAAYIVYQLVYNKYCLKSDEITSIGLTQIPTLYEILQNGIRHLRIIICGMKLKFDYPLFCVKNKEIQITLETLPYNEFPIKLADS